MAKCRCGKIRWDASSEMWIRMCVIDMVPQGGLWAFTDAGLVYRVDHANKSLTLVAADASNPDSTCFQEMVRACAKALGWQVN